MWKRVHGYDADNKKTTTKTMVLSNWIFVMQIMFCFITVFEIKNDSFSMQSLDENNTDYVKIV